LKIIIFYYGIEVDDCYGMINEIIHINFDGLNLNNIGKLILSETKLEFEDFLAELFKLIDENQNSTNLENSLFSPLSYFPIFHNKDTVTLNTLFENFNFQQEGLNSLYEPIKPNQMDLSNLLERLKLRMEGNQKIFQNNNVTQEVYNDLKQEVSITLEKTPIKDILKKVNFQADKINLEPLSLDLNNRKNDSVEVSRLINTLSDEVLLKNEKANINEININKHQKTNFENQTSQINLNFSESFQHNSIQQRFEIPIARLNEVSHIIFKAVSSSQKTLIVHIEPSELGKILIKLSMDSSGVRADLKVDYPYVKEMLTNLIPEIRSNLQSSGVKISEFLLDLTRDHKGYSDLPYGQGQRKHKDNQRFFEYFA
jgi:Tfp pilus assembly protein PilN